MSNLDELIQELRPDGVKYKTVKEMCQRVKVTSITAKKMK